MNYIVNIVQYKYSKLKSQDMYTKFISQENIELSNEPKEHHYLPQFYLRSFHFSFKKKNKLYKLYSYDKMYEPKVTAKTTKEICFEKHRNTIEMDGHRDFFIEKSFSELEGVMSNGFRLIQDYSAEYLKLHRKNVYVFDRYKYLNTSRIIPLDSLLDEPYFYRLINYFFYVFYWRLTQHDDYFTLSTTESFLSRSIGKLFHRSQNDQDFGMLETFLPELHEHMKTSFLIGEQNNFMKLYKSLIYPLSGIFQKRAKSHSFYKFHIGSDNLVSSDAPFVTNELGANLSNFFIFTWSPNTVFVNIPKSNKKTIVELIDWSFKLSMLNYLQAKRYVFGKDKQTLENVIYYANMRYGLNGVNELKAELFALLK